MSTHFETVWFDLDGTLIHTAPDLVNAVNNTLAQHDHPKANYASIVTRINEGALGMIAGGLGLDKQHQTVQTLLKDFPTHYLATICVDSKFYDGMENIINRLEQDGTPWGIVTNKAERYAIPLVEQLGLSHRFSALVCGDTTPESKPSPIPLTYACKQTNVKPENCIFIGDSIKDIQAGKSCNMTTVAVAYGYLDVGSNVQDWQADHIIQSPQDLEPILWNTDD